VRYLAAKHGAGTLWPTDPAARADVERWMDWALSTAQPAVNPIFLNLIRTPPEKRDMAAVAAGKIRSEQIWQIAEARLAGRRFVGGDHLTIGDIPLGVWAHRWLNLPIERPRLPALEGWYARLGERAPYRTHVMLPLT